PQEPRKADNQFQYRYNCILQIKTNTTIESLTINSV
ncbi:unnamed protein product, partial [marine sediment metagenome]